MSDVKKGNLSINSENIFPIIKKWLYSDHDIFVRELISNASDAITKLKYLVNTKEAEVEDNPEYKIIVKYNEEDATLQFIDNGIGMTEDEIEKYINQIAFSGAADFVKNFKDKEGKDQIIGHFGLGFYSAFMVSKLVTIDTLSYQKGAEAAFWSCDGGNEFEIKKSDKTERGTTITLYLSDDDGKEFKNSYKIKNTIKKYCNFMPYNIYFEGKDEALDLDDMEADLEVESSDSTDAEKAPKTPKAPTPINNPHPLYLETPSKCTDEDYKKFYKELFVDFKEPLFWIHLNMDYPFNLKGILYFPKLGTEFDAIDGQIKLYNNQVYVADNIKEVIPEFLLLLKGIIDCPDLPLNVSRSFLQNDGFVKKISEYIVRKVADKLNSLFNTERENYQRYWDDINPFIKFGMLKDEKFYDRIKDSVVYKYSDGTFCTLPEYKEKNKEKTGDNVYYTSDPKAQSQYIKLLESNDISVLELKERIDQAFISQIESKNENTHFKRVDSDLSDVLEKSSSGELSEEDKSLNEKISELFKQFFSDNTAVEIKSLKSDDVAGMIVESEDSRRMNDMMKMYSFGMPMDMPASQTLILNKNHSLVKYICDDANTDSEMKETVAKQLRDIAKLSHGTLTPDELGEFIKRTNKITIDGLK